jgi:hypothetical protein
MKNVMASAKTEGAWIEVRSDQSHKIRSNLGHTSHTIKAGIRNENLATMHFPEDQNNNNYKAFFF